MRLLLSSIQPPVILHCAGSGGLAGVGVGLSSLLHSPGVASREAYWMKPVMSKPVGSLFSRAGCTGVGAGIAAGVGHGIGFRLWADAFVPSPVISSSSTTPATLNRLVSCSNPRILKLLPSVYCNFLLLCLADELSRLCCSDQARGLVEPPAPNLVGAGILASQQVLQECGKRLSALGSHCRNFHELIRRTVRMFWIWDNRISVRAMRMTVRREQLRMVKRSCLCDGPWVRQAVAQEVDQVDFFLSGQAQHLHVRIHVLDFFNCVEVATAVIELHYLLQRQLAAVVEVRGRQGDVA